MHIKLLVMVVIVITTGTLVVGILILVLVQLVRFQFQLSPVLIQLIILLPSSCSDSSAYFIIKVAITTIDSSGRCGISY